MNDLSTISTEALRKEIERRESEAREKMAAQRKAREVVVLCPTCNGSGHEDYFDMRVAVGEDDGKRMCGTCRGEGRITALRA